MTEVKSASPPLCKMCQKRHWDLCADMDPKGYMVKIPRGQQGRRIHVRASLETEHFAEELDDAQRNEPRGVSQ